MLSFLSAPLDDGHRARLGELKIQVVKLFGAGEAVGIHVHQVGAAGSGPSGRFGCTRESTKVGEITPSRTPRPSPRGAGERGLARAELTRATVRPLRSSAAPG